MDLNKEVAHCSESLCKGSCEQREKGSQVPVKWHEVTVVLADAAVVDDEDVAGMIQWSLLVTGLLDALVTLAQKLTGLTGWLLKLYKK